MCWFFTEKIDNGYDTIAIMHCFQKMKNYSKNDFLVDKIKIFYPKNEL